MKEACGLLGIKVKAVGKVVYSRFYLQIGGNIANNAPDWISGEAKRRALTMNKFIQANIICTPPHTQKKIPFDRGTLSQYSSSIQPHCHV